MKPESRLIVATADEDRRELFMSFGLLNDLCRVIGDPNRASTVDLDAPLADLVLRIVTAPRDKYGQTTQSIDDFHHPIVEIDEAVRIFDWVKGHTLDFFTSRLSSSLQAVTDRKEALKEVGSKLDGLKD